MAIDLILEVETLMLRVVDLLFQFGERLAELGDFVFATQDPIGTTLDIVAERVHRSLALTDFGVKAGDPIAFFVSVFDEAVEAERHPAYRPIELTAPDALFEARNWRA